MITHNLYNLNSEDVVNLTGGIDSGFDLTIQNLSNHPIYLGGDDEINTSNFGYKLDASQSFSIELSGQDDLWVYSDDNDVTIAVLRAHLEIGK